MCLRRDRAQNFSCELCSVFICALFFARLANLLLFDLVERLVCERLERHILEACRRGEVTSVRFINQQHFNAKLLGALNECKRANVCVLVGAHKEERVVHKAAASADALRAWHALQILAE